MSIERMDIVMEKDFIHILEFVFGDKNVSKRKGNT